MAASDWSAADFPVRVAKVAELLADGAVTYVNSEPVLSDLDINEDANCPIMYKQSWSNTLNDIVTNFLRNVGILQSFEDVIIPRIILDEIAKFYSNDVTKYRSFEDYMHAILICKYFSMLKQTRKPDNDNDRKVQVDYKLTKKATLTTTKILKALEDFKQGKFQLFNGATHEDLEVYFIDHTVNKVNLQRFSYPKGATYTTSEDELALITALRDATKFVDEIKPSIGWDPEQEDIWGILPEHAELRKRVSTGYFKSAKTGTKWHMMVNHKKNGVFALDDGRMSCYLLFVYRFFSIIIHEKMNEKEPPAVRKMAANVVGSRYRAILEQLEQSGL